MRKITGALAVLMCSGAAWAGPTELLTNGGFESGTLAGWTKTFANGANAIGNGGYGDIYVSSTAAGGNPLYGLAGGMPGPGPSGGTYYMVYDQGGPFGARLEQSFVATGAQTTVSFDVYGGDSDFSAPLNSGNFSIISGATQYLRVDLVSGAAGSGGAVVANLFDLTQPDNFTYQTILQDVTAFLVAGNTYSLRFEAVDTNYYLLGGWDNASVLANAIPLPTPALMTAAGFGLVVVRRRR